jgi:hypothetical protein
MDDYIDKIVEIVLVTYFTLLLFAGLGCVVAWLHILRDC